MTRLKSLLVISIFVLLYATYYWVVPIVVNIQARTELIESIVKKEFGTQINIEKPRLKMGLMPAIWLDAASLSVLDKNQIPFIVKNPKLKIRLLPLFVGKTHIAYFSCDKIKAKLRLDKDYKLYIGDYLFIKSSNPKVSMEDAQMNIESYELNLRDDLQDKNIVLKGDYLNLDKYNSKKHIKFSTNSTLKIENRYSIINTNVNLKLPLKKGFGTNDIAFDGTITNLNLEDFSPYVRKFTKNRIKNLTGILNIQADTKALSRKTTQIKTDMSVDNFSVMGKDKISSIYFKDKLNSTIIVEVSKNTLDIKKLKLLSGRMNFNISGKINKITSKNPILDLVVFINKSRIEDFIALIPAKNISNLDLNLIALKKYGYYSDIEGNLSIKGRADRPELLGDITSSNGYIIKPLPSNIAKANVKLKFTGDKFFMEVVVPVDLREKVTIKGTIDLYGEKKSNLEVTSTENINLQRTESILNPMHEIFYFEIGPLPVMSLQGLGNINLKIKGTKKNPHLFGVFNFRNTTASFNGIKMQLKNGDGSLFFKDTDTHFITKKATLDGKPIRIDGKCSLKGILDYNITAHNQDLKTLMNVIESSPLLMDLQKSVPPIANADGQLNITLKLNGVVKNIDDFKLGKSVIASGKIKLLGNNITFEGMQIAVKNIMGDINFNNNDADFDLYSIIDKSKIKIKGRIKNNVLNLKAKLDDTYFLYSDIPVKIFSGNLELNNNKLTLYKVNATFDSMPVLVDGTITDIFKNPNYNLYINSKPTQKFIEKYLNKNTTYPLKIKGDIIYSSRIQGTKDALNAKTEINLQEDSNIYYMGSTLGDVNNPIRVFLDTNISKNSIYVNNFQYDKLIKSQNNKEFISQQLNAKGRINLDKNNITLQNFRIKTQNPTDAKIFNILFKRPLIKQGLFTSNIVLNSSVTSPKLLGFLNFTGIDIPLLDTTIKDISLDFADKNIEIKSKGEIFSNKITLFSNMENRIAPPYVLSDVDIYLGNLDINEIAKRLNKLDFESGNYKLSDQKQDTSDFNITNLIIKNAKLKADSVFVKNVFAKDLTADFSLNEKMLFSLNDFKFEVAQGNVNGDFKYNLLNSNAKLDLHMNDVNANSISDALFDLQDQIYGSLTGQVELTCNGKTHKTCMDTLSGTGGFRVADGKMPKLGSLEYLLKAGNLVKSGITGITINSVIELLTPLKTGQFQNINGNFTIESGIANSVQIFSKGKDLSVFLTGTYNFSTLIADMKVFGRISKKITNVLGPVGNTSLNTLFNTIPGLNLDEKNSADFVKNLNKIPGFELNDKSYRIFSAEVYGDINGEGYVQSFKWIE